MTPPDQESEVTVLAFGGRFSRRFACALRLHKMKESPAPSSAGPASIRYCIWCGETDDASWRWVYTDHRVEYGRWVSRVRYRREASPSP